MLEGVMMMDKNARTVSPKFAEFCERIYNISGSNYSFQDLTRFVRIGLAYAYARGTRTQIAAGANGSMEIATAITALIADRYFFPFWVIPPAMATVISNVRPPEEWDVGSMLFGFPAMYFIMPRNHLKGDLDEEVAIVSVAHLTSQMRAELEKAGVSILRGEGTKGGESVLFICASSNEGVVWHLSIPVPPDGIVTSELLKSLPNTTDVPANNETGWLHNTLLPYVTTILGVMSARPEVMGEASARLKTVGKGKREVWSPRILGEKYVRSFNEGRGIPTGKHVKMHWRSGHFRSQRHGPGNAMIKQVLIDAVLVNASVPE